MGTRFIYVTKHVGAGNYIREGNNYKTLWQNGRTSQGVNNMKSWLRIKLSIINILKVALVNILCVQYVVMNFIKRQT